MIKRLFLLITILPLLALGVPFTPPSVDNTSITDPEQTKLGFITVIQAVDLDAIESDTATNNAKVTNVSTALSTGTVSASTYGITSDGGSDDVVIAAATASVAGVMTAAQVSKLNSITAPVVNSKIDLRNRFPISYSMIPNINNTADTGATGTGSANAKTQRIQIKTAGTAGGTAWAHWALGDGAEFYLQSGVVKNIVDWDLDLAIYTSLALDNMGSGVEEAFFYYGRDGSTDTASTAPNDKLLGVEVRTTASGVGRIFLISHDGISENAIDSGIDISNQDIFLVSIVKTGTSVSWFISTDGGATFPEATGSPSTTNIPAGDSTSKHFYWQIGIQNLAQNSNIEMNTQDIEIFFK